VRGRRQVLSGRMHAPRTTTIAPPSAAMAWWRPAKAATAPSPRGRSAPARARATTAMRARSIRRPVQSKAARGPCSHNPITGCIPDDGCCPPGCSAVNDRDCSPTCRDGHIGAGETCDPPSTCPTACPDDGDPCTAEQLSGDANACNVACRHLPITACSGGKRDSCCPTGCSPGSDSDC
jgi:hypothetical protein